MRLVVAFAIAVLFSLTVSATDFVVIDSIESSMKSGDRLDGTKPLSLIAGQSLTLLSASGEIIRLDGPHDGVLTSAHVISDSGIITSLSRLLKDTNKKHLRLAGFRSSPSNLWTVNVGVPGNWCMHPDRETIFHRRIAKGDALLVIEQIEDGEATRQSTHVWQHNSHHLNWPGDIPRRPALEFVAYISVASEPDSLHLFTTPDHLPSEAHLAAWMADRGCTRQAIKLVDIIANRRQ